MANYSSLIIAQAYFDGRLYTLPWDSASPSDRLKSLKMATKIIDRLNLYGAKATTEQELQFPRDEDTEVPIDIEDATAEIALALLDGIDPDFEYENLGMESQAYGNLKSTYDRSTEQEYRVAGVPSIAAWRILRPYMRDHLNVDLNRVS